MTGGIIVRQCSSRDEFHACVALQREIWGEPDLDVEPVSMFIVAAHTGGQVLGAFDGSVLVGCTLAVAALRNGAAYLHSHMTGVRASYRDRDVGRMLKLFQREEALSRDIGLIEWTFDPLELRNAHFNLNRLGAVCRRYLPNFYGLTTSPLHRGIETDRLVAEWYLNSPHVIAALNGESVAGFSALAIDVPAELENWQASGDLTRVQAVQARVRERFSEGFAKGYAALSVLRTSSGSAYQLAPWSDY